MSTFPANVSSLGADVSTFRADVSTVRRLFGLTADAFLRIFQNLPEQYHGDVRFRSLCHVADLIAEPDDV